MVRKEQGNTALVFPVGKSEKWRQPRKRSRRILNKGLPMSEKLLYLASVILCVVLASIILTRYAKVTELSMAIRETELKIEKSQEVNLQLETEKEKLGSIDRIRQYAEEHGLKWKGSKNIPSIRP